MCGPFEGNAIILSFFVSGDGDLICGSAWMGVWEYMDTYAAYLF